MPGTRWHCLAFAGMQGMALATGLSTERWLHHPAPVQGCSGDFCPPALWIQPGPVPRAAASRRPAGRQRNRKLPQGYFSLCGSVCSAFCHMPASVPNPPESSWHATDPCTQEQDVPCLHSNFPMGATSLEHAAMLGTPLSLLSSTQPSTAGSLGPLRCHPAPWGALTVAGQCRGGYFLTTWGISSPHRVFPCWWGISLQSRVFPCWLL